jgi:hypothetical protein
VSSAAAAQTAPRTQASPEATVRIDVDARATREQLRELMQRFPPDLARILKMDPSLLSSEAYLAQYPALATFIAAHPEIAHNPSFFFSFVETGWNEWQPVDARAETARMWRNFMEGLQVFAIFIAVSGLIAWFVRTFIDYRRWLRLSKVQTDVHNKLLERFAGSGDLLAYVQSPAGRRFLESAPIPLDPATRHITAPLGRILWAVQAGVVVFAVGVGFQFVSGQLIDDIGQPMSVLAALSIALGIGLIASGAVSYVLSRRLGLLDQSPVLPPERSEPPLA